MATKTCSVEEAGEILGIGRSVAYRLAKLGELPVLRLGRNLRVPLAALDDLLASAKPAAKKQGHA